MPPLVALIYMPFGLASAPEDFFLVLPGETPASPVRTLTYQDGEWDRSEDEMYHGNEDWDDWAQNVVGFYPTAPHIAVVWQDHTVSRWR